MFAIVSLSKVTWQHREDGSTKIRAMKCCCKWVWQLRNAEKLLLQKPLGLLKYNRYTYNKSSRTVEDNNCKNYSGTLEDNHFKNCSAMLKDSHYKLVSNAEIVSREGFATYLEVCDIFFPLFPCEWYGLVCEYLTPVSSPEQIVLKLSTHVMVWIRNEVWSRWKSYLLPSLQFFFLVRYDCAYLVKWSMTIKIHLCPPELRSKLKKSVDSIWRGAVVKIGWSGAHVWRLVRLYFRQLHTWWIKCFPYIWSAHPLRC